ncbi:putative RNA-directed DNA polymerase [Helianthus annuus]|nr:putative RNA-directed DNA polymerase [Helianthus annuus]
MNYDEAIKSKESSDWMIAMHNEMESLHRNGTWDLVPIPKRKRPVKCKWVYKLKEPVNPTEKPRYKARLVAKGYSQIPGIDYTDVYSPVVKHTSIRVLLGLVASNDYELEQLDVTTTFLNSELEEEIFMQKPEGFVVPGKENYVCKLNKSLYGLKQSPRQWYERFDSFMTSHEFKRCTCDSCVYNKNCDDGSMIYLLLYVDDMLIATKDMKEIQKLKDQLKADFEMKDLGAAKKILGMEIVRDRKSRVLHLSQKNYIEKVLRRFNMHEAKPVNTPFAAHFKLSSALSPTTETDMAYMARVPYSSVVGSFIYAMICTRWIMLLARSVDIWRTRGKNIGKQYSGSFVICAVHYGKDLDKRRSITGYVFTLHGCAISWKAQLQFTVALSSTEAEYMVITKVVKEDICLKGLFKELDDRIKVTTIFCDNQSAIFLSKDQMFHDQTKHIDICYNFVRDIIEKGDCVIDNIDTDYNPTDVFTKSLPIVKFKLLDLMGISNRN